MAICNYSKDIHYNAKGSDFWADHLMADEIFGGIDDFIDQVNENLFLGFEAFTVEMHLSLSC